MTFHPFDLVLSYQMLVCAFCVFVGLTYWIHITLVMLLLHFLCEEDTYIATYLMMLESQKTHKYFHLDATDYDLFRLTFRSLVKRCLPKLHNRTIPTAYKVFNYSYNFSLDMTKIEVDFKSLCDRWFKRLYLGELPIRVHSIRYHPSQKI